MAAVAAACLAMAGCSGDDDDDDAGPADGSWHVDTLTCNTAAQPIPSIDVNIENDHGTFILAFASTAGSCTSTIAEDYTYPSANEILITPTSNDCVPDAASCAPLFGGLTTCPVPPPVQFTFAAAPATLTFTKVSNGPPVDACPVGQTITYTMSPN